MRRATLLAFGVLASACGPSAGPESAAIVVQVNLEQGLPATCVQLQILSSDGSSLGERKMVRAAGKDSFRVAVFRGGFPQQLTFSARPMVGAACADPLAPNGPAVSERGTFETGAVPEVMLELRRPIGSADSDGDGYVSNALGGPDCLDADASFNPGAEEECTTGVDRNCNGLSGCSDPACAGKACVDPPARLAFVSPPRTVEVDGCSEEVRVQTQDRAGTPANVLGPTPVSLSASPSASFALYADSGCTQPVTSVVIPALANSAGFYFKGTVAGDVTLSAAATGSEGASQVATLVAGPPVALAFDTPPQTVAAGHCSAGATLTLRDAFGNAAPARTALALGLTLDPSTGLALFTDAACSSGVSSLSFPVGASSATLHFRGRAAGSYELTATAGALPPVSQTETIVPDQPAAAVFVTAPRRASAGACSQPLTVELRDGQGNPSPVATALSLALAASPPSNFAFYEDSACANATGAVSFAAGSAQATFYFRGTATGQVVTTATAGSLPPVSQTQTVDPAAPVRLVFTTAPFDPVAGACAGPVRVQTRDGFGSPSGVALATPVGFSSTAASGFSFYADSGCSTAAATVTIPAGQDTAQVYFRATVAETVTLTASATGLANATQAETVSPAAAAALAFVSAPQTLVAGSCSGAVSIQTRDTYGNAVVNGAARAVGLQSGASDVLFFSDAGCSTAATGTSFAAGSSTATFFFRSTKVGNPSITVSTSGLAGASQAQTVLPAPAAALVFSSAPKTLAAGACSDAAMLETRDTYGNVSPVSAATAAALSASGSGVTFYSNATCTQLVSGASIPAGGSGAGFYFKASSVGAVTLTATAVGLAPASQAQTINPAPASVLQFSTPAQTLTAGDCSAATAIQSRDAFGNVAAVTSSVVVSLSGSAAVSFFSGSGCTGPLTSVTIASGTSSTPSFYFRSTVAGTLTLLGSATNYTPATQSESILAGGPSQLAFTTQSQTVVAGACSAAATVQVRDTYGNPTVVSAQTAVGLGSTPSGLTFYSDGACASAVGSVNVPAGGGSATFYFSGTAAGLVTVSATAISLTGATQQETIAAAQPTQLAFVTPPRSVLAGACSPIVTVQARDTYGNPSPVTAARPVTLTGSLPGTTFYLDASCTSAAPQVSIAAGTSAASFYFKATRTGALDVTAASAGLGSITQTETVSPGLAAKLAFVTAPQTLTAGGCSAVAGLQTQDDYGNVSNVGANTTVTLSSSVGSNLTFYSNSSCTSSISLVTIPSGTSAASFYFRSNAAGSVALTASASGLDPATQNQTVNPGPPAKLAFITAEQTVSAGSCSGPTIVQSQDALGNASTLASATTVSLTATPSSGFAFYSDSSCTVPASSVAIAAGANAVSFHFKGTVAGPVDVTAAGGGLASATQRETIAPQPPTRLVITTAAQTLPAGSCSGVVTVQARDSLNNPSPVGSNTAVSLSGPAGVTFFSNATCTTSISQVTIPGGASAANFYFSATSAGTNTLTATASGMTPASQSQTISPATASRLAFTSAAQNVAAGSCSSAAAIQTRDAYGNASPVTSALTVSLASSPVGGVAFFSDPACSTAVSSISVAASTSSAALYFKGTVAQAVDVSISAAGFSGATQTETVRAGPATKLAFASNPLTVMAGSCSGAVSLQARDSYDNPATVTAATTVLLAAAPATGFGFFSNASCGTATSQVVIPSGSSGATFYFRGTAAGQVDVDATASGLAPAVQRETITAASPARLAFTTGAHSVAAGSCSGVLTVQTRDLYGNPATVGAATAVNLTADAPGVTFHTASNCSGGVTSVTISAGSSSASFYFKSTTAGTVTLTARSGTLADATQAQTVSPLAATKLAFASSQQTVTAGACSALAVVETRDQYDNVSAVGSPLGVTLSAAPVGGAQFFSDSSCATPTSSITVAGGASSAGFYFKGTIAQTVTLQASAASFTSGSQAQQIQAAAASVLVFTTSNQTLRAGACSAAHTVEARDSYGNLATNGLAVSLSAPMSLGVSFYSDSSCATGTSSVAIPPGSSSASFYFKGISGGTIWLRGTGPGITADAAQDETIIPAARSGLCAFPGGGGTVSVDCAISPAHSDTSKTLLFYQAGNGSADASRANVRCVLTSTSNIRCTRQNGGTTDSIAWTTVELASGVRVQHLDSGVGCSQSGSTRSYTLPAAVNPASTFVLFSGERAGNDNGGALFRTVKLVSGTQLDVTSSVAETCGSAELLAFQVVELAGATVRRGTATLASGESTAVTTVPDPGGSADLSRTFLLYSWRTSSAGAAMCQRGVRGSLGSANTLRFSRGDGAASGTCDVDAIDEISWERVELPSGSRVTELSVSIGSGVATGSASLAAMLPDTSRTAAFAGGQVSSGQSMGEGTLASDDIIGVMRARHEIDAAGTTLTLTRPATAGSASFTSYVVELVP